MGKFLMGIWMIWIILQIFSQTLVGQWITDEDAEKVENLIGFSEIQSDESVPIAYIKAAWGFFSSVPQMLVWDYSFLEGDWELMKWILLYPLSMAAVFGLIAAASSVLFGVIGR